MTLDVVTIIILRSVNPKKWHCYRLPLANDYTYMVVSNEVAVSYQISFTVKSTQCFQ